MIFARYRHLGLFVAAAAAHTLRSRVAPRVLIAPCRIPLQARGPELQSPQRQRTVP
jgi:hypothetical protein